MMTARIHESITSAIRYINAMRGLMINDIIIAQIKLTGALIHILKSIWYVFCTFVTSVVSLVTSPAVLNLSMLEKA